MKRNHFLFIVITFLLCSINCHLNAQIPTIQWQKCLGGSSYDRAKSIQLTSDSGYIITGLSQSNDGDVSGNHGNGDVWIVKLFNTGNIEWQKCLGGWNEDFIESIQQTSDGGYIFTGSSRSNDGDVSGHHGSSTEWDVWIVKLTNNGNIEWQKCLGGSEGDVGYSILQTSDGGYILTGSTLSNNGDVSGNHGLSDVWIIKLSNNGNIEWKKCLGGSRDDIGKSIQQTSDGGYIIAGETTSNDGDVSGNHGPYYMSDIWIVKLSNIGNIQWQKCLGGSDNEQCCTIKQTFDGGYIVSGITNSNNGDVSGYHNVGNGDVDIWIVKLFNTGNIEWQKCFGGWSNDFIKSIQQTSDSGFIFTGYTGSNDGDVGGNHGGCDVWIGKISNTGNIEWQKCFGGSNQDVSESIQLTSDSGYVFAANTSSNDGDVNGNHGGVDVWIVKIAHNNTSINENNKLGKTQLFPNPAKSIVNITCDVDLIGEKYQVCNSIGQVILTGFIDSESMRIELSKFSSGLYLIRIGNNNNQTIKLIIE